MMDKYYEIGERIGNYQITKRLGEGRYGIVYLVRNHQSHPYILKQLKQDMQHMNLKKLFYEPETLRQINDPRIPKFIEEIKTENLQAYVLEYMEGTVFEDLIMQQHHKFSRSEIYNIAGQLLDILEMLHQHQIVHRDIRLPNVILNQNQELTLIDFGLARFMNKERYVKQVDYWYMGNFLIHLYYTTYNEPYELEEKPWYEELTLNTDEANFLKRLMGIEKEYEDGESIKQDLYHLTAFK